MKNDKKNFENKKILVPFFRPHISKSDHYAVQKALKSRILTNGPLIEKFERDFSVFSNSKNAVAVSSATAALHLALHTAGIKNGDEVIIPDITFAATANVVLMVGATPVLADIEFDDLNISIDSIKNCINKKTKAIIPVHFAGKSCKISEIVKIAKKSNLIVIEDCAHALGTKFEGKHVGNFGDMGCFSFYPTKNITTLEGGMLISKSNEYAREIRRLRNHGINRTLKDRYSIGLPWEYDIISYGYNYRIDEIRSVLGISQLKRIRRINQNRQNAFRYYYENLKDIKGVTLPSLTDLKNNSCHLFVIKIDKDEFGRDRNYIFKKLLEKGISTSVHYKPLHEFSVFKKSTKRYTDLINSNLAYEQILSLPFYFGITKKDMDIVIKALKNIK